MTSRDAVALVLATAVAIAWVMAVFAAVTEPDALSVRGSVALYGVGGTLVGGVCGWLAKGSRKDGDS